MIWLNLKMIAETNTGTCALALLLRRSKKQSGRIKESTKDSPARRQSILARSGHLTTRLNTDETGSDFSCTNTGRLVVGAGPAMGGRRTAAVWRSFSRVVALLEHCPQVSNTTAVTLVC